MNFTTNIDDPTQWHSPSFSHMYTSQYYDTPKGTSDLYVQLAVCLHFQLQGLNQLVTSSTKLK